MKSNYITIEGIKGSGKSSVFKRLFELLREEGIEFQVMNTTQPMPISQPLELISKYCPVLRKLDWFNELLYARRASWHATCLSSSTQLVIGDRSILTSYVTRWYRWRTPEKCISRVDRMESSVPAPNYIVWLYCDPETAIKRIMSRPKRDYGRHDELPTRLYDAHNAYYEVFTLRQPPRLSDSQWLVINAMQDVETIAEQIFSWIKYEIQKTKTTTK